MKFNVYHLIAEIENTNFSIEFEGGQQLVLEPYTLKPVQIVFVPSASTAYSGEIQIRTKAGESSTPFPEITVVCKAGQSVNQQIKESLIVQKPRILTKMNVNVKWTYPLLIQLLTKQNLTLEGLKTKEKVMFKIVDMEQLKKHVKINLKDHNVQDINESLSFDVKFLPYQPFKLTTELQVKVQSGDLWRFKLQINALEPQIDDITVITSEINQLSKLRQLTLKLILLRI